LLKHERDMAAAHANVSSLFENVEAQPAKRLPSLFHFS
jgi:outer membrane protein TolC